jgi:hypothetical protein
MPTDLFEEKNGGPDWRDSGRDFDQMQVIASVLQARRDNTLALPWSRCAKDLRRSGSLVARSDGPRSMLSPALGDLFFTLGERCSMLVVQSRRLARERLLATPAQVIDGHGYGGASIDLISAEAGYSKGAIYSLRKQGAGLPRAATRVHGAGYGGAGAVRRSRPGPARRGGYGLAGD